MTVDELVHLFKQTGRHHHAAFADADGVDPEWPLWYAAYLQAHLWDKLGRLLTRSEIVYLLVSSDLEVKAKGVTEWQPLYAERFLEFAAG